MTGLIITTLLSYMLGSVSGSLLLGRLRHVDIRRLGSGNAGGTNAFRTQGTAFALGVVLIDVGKGVLAASLPALLPRLLPAISGIASGPDIVDQTLLCGMAAVLGHCYPVWHGFRGGKGAAAAVGALIVIQPWVLIPMITVWLVILTISGLVGLATMLAAISLIPAFWWSDASPSTMLFAVVLALFIVFTHRSNIRNMIDCTEYRFERVRLKYWLGGRR
jgi:glycerol-3-phosphate acyltransferase PlsY